MRGECVCTDPTQRETSVHQREGIRLRQSSDNGVERLLSLRFVGRVCASQRMGGILRGWKPFWGYRPICYYAPLRSRGHRAPWCFLQFVSMARLSCVALLAAASFVVSDAFVSPPARWGAASMSARQPRQRCDVTRKVVCKYKLFMCCS